MEPMEAMLILNQAVQSGMTFLDQHTPGWLDRVDSAIQDGKFDINGCYSCALSLAAEDHFYVVTKRFNLTRSDTNVLGFSAWDETDLNEDQEHGAIQGEANETLIEARTFLPFPCKSWFPLTLAWEWNIIAHRVGVAVMVYP